MFGIKSKQEEQEQKAILENRIIYSLPVRQGFWKEELALQDEKNYITSYKKEHCQLLVQNTRKMFRNLLRPTALAAEAPYVLYGVNYQFMASDIQLNMDSTNKLKRGLYLSGLITEKIIHITQHFIHGCLLTLSNNNQPCVRSTFKIVCADSKNRDGQQVLFGEDVFLQIAESALEPLYVQCENSSLATIGGILSLKLSRIPDIYCRFKFFHWEPLIRFKTTGTGFSPNCRIIIQHTASSRNLAVQPKLLIPTLFGVECMITCHTFKDAHKMETAENFWKILTEPKGNTNLFVRAAKGEDIPEELFV